VRLTPEDHRYLTSLYDDTVPLPTNASRELSSRSPRLAELREAYAASDVPALDASRWNEDAVESFLDLRYFRGETLITWHYRELPRINRLKYYLYLLYVRERDELGLLRKLDEDGAFGCWTYSFPDHDGLVSRDLLDSVNEIAFLERALSLSGRDRFSVLDIGAGYGRLAHRMTEAYGQLDDYCCVDAVPESSFVCDYYLRYRESNRARVVGLHEVEATLQPGHFDIAVNIHSFPETTYSAIDWWMRVLEPLEIPYLLVIPNEPDELLTLEADESRRDFLPLITGAGYELSNREPVIDDVAVRELLPLDDQFFLFKRTTL
jgi:putative sugar O-methyltransferase